MKSLPALLVAVWVLAFALGVCAHWCIRWLYKQVVGK